jgi:hypothetical protein
MNVDGVRIAGPLLLQAGPMASPSLLQWGDGTYAGSASAPGASAPVARSEVFVDVNRRATVCFVRIFLSSGCV